MATKYVCKGCQGGTTRRSRLCQSCCNELSVGLYGGRWVQQRGVWTWVPNPPPISGPMTPGREQLLRIAHTRYTWHGHRDDSTVRLEGEYQQWRKTVRKAAAA